MLVKLTSGADGWAVYHRGIDSSTPEDYRLRLDGTNARIDNTDGSRWNRTAPTSSVFSLGTDGSVNANGSTYVAYLFAHNNSDGGFGPDADQDVIKCGSYTTDGSGNAVVNLGFEPQFVITKGSNYISNWQIHDVMRGATVGGNAETLRANNSDPEVSQSLKLEPNPTGFTSSQGVNGFNGIYMAIRRGPLAEPTSATDVFAISYRVGGPPNAVSGFPVDMGLFTNKASSDNKYIGARLMEAKRLYTNLNNAEGSSSELAFDYQNGFINRSDTSTDTIHWMWKRAPGYFDVCCYSGTGSARTVSHNLGVAPEMMWVKRRDTTGSWMVYHKGLNGGTNPEQYVIYLEATEAENQGGSGVWNNTAPTSSVFSVNNNNGVNNSSGNYIAYLFATVAGVSKVGSFSHTSGQTQNIDCGFSSGARFVLVKQYGGTGNWFVYDTARGIVAGNDPRLQLNTTAAENTANDDIDPLSSGFTLTTNFSGGDYIFYAIA